MMRCIFTLTAGRTGTAYLAELLRCNMADIAAHHEILSYKSFGVDTPDISHMHAFNAFGNTEEVRAFWQRKWQRIQATGARTYAETSHVLMKAGMVENLATLAQEHEVHFIHLTRNFYPTLVSYHHRHDFTNMGNQWLWYLDPNYPRNKVDATPFRALGIHGVRLWYLCEINVRAHYYRLKYAHAPHLHFHHATLESLNDPEAVAALLAELGAPKPAGEVIIPPKKNENANTAPLSPQHKEMLDTLLGKFSFDAQAYAGRLLEKTTTA